MPDQTKTIGSGLDYATITLWEADSDVSSGFWKGEIQDASEFNETVSITGSIGTESAVNYVWLTVRDAERHGGVAGGGARMRGSAGGHVIEIDESYVRIEHLEIQQDSSGSSDEGIRIRSNVTDVVVSRCIIWSSANTNDQDGVYAGNWTVTNICIDNCIIYGFGRAGIHAQNYNGNRDQSWFIDHCTLIKNGSAGESQSAGINVLAPAVGAVVDLDVYNTACLDNHPDGADWGESATFGSVTWSGSNNADSDGSLAGILSSNARQNLTLGDTTQVSGSHFIVNETLVGSEDYQLKDDTVYNTPYGNGVDRQGSEPSARQDFSTDIAGNTRSTTSPAPDIGASEYTAAGGGTAYTQSISGSITPSGALSKKIARLLVGSSLLVGVLSKKTKKNFFGTTTLSGTLLKKTSKSFSGSTTPLGILVKKTSKSFSGSATPSGVLFTKIVFTQAIAGTITMIGTVYKLTKKSFSGSATLTGVINKKTNKQVVGTFTPSGVITKKVTKLLTGSSTLTGSIATSFITFKSISGSLSMSGVVAGVIVIITPAAVGVRKMFYRMLGRR